MRVILLLTCLAFVGLSYTTAQFLPTTKTSTTTRNPLCSIPCPRIYRPICARYNDNLRTYTNLCLMQADLICAQRLKPVDRPRIQFSYMGRCNEERKGPFTPV